MSISGKGGHHPTLQDFFQVGASGWTFGTGSDKQDILLIPSAKEYSLALGGTLACCKLSVLLCWKRVAQEIG